MSNWLAHLSWSHAAALVIGMAFVVELGLKALRALARHLDTRSLRIPNGAIYSERITLDFRVGGDCK